MTNLQMFVSTFLMTFHNNGFSFMEEGRPGWSGWPARHGIVKLLN